MSTITVPTGFSYVAASLVSTVVLLRYQAYSVSKSRKIAGIEYPQLYAEKSEMAASPAAVAFNCSQRAHQNTLEDIAQIYIMTVVLGLKHPIPAASALGLWVVGRFAYTIGYASGNPAKRNNIVARICYIPSMLTLVFGSVYSVYELISAGI